jgi:hypothetical protein
MFLCFGSTVITAVNADTETQWIKFLLNSLAMGEARIISGIALVIIGVITFISFIKSLKYKRVLWKFGIKGIWLELFDGETVSLFDKYLEEVLYLFENSEADVVVFDDMDRFDVNRIFIRLREINTLVNERRDKKCEEPIRFFYLLKDDIFTSKDRTKFFDFIIPIIPVLDTSNAFNKFKEYFDKQGIFNEFEAGFLQGISLYVDDMRLFKNIFNEFLIYRSRIDITELDVNKLLAIIVYKNIFPRDFNGLQLKRGFVYTLFANKKNYIAETICQLDKEINDTQKRIENANEHLNFETELNDALYYYRNHDSRKHKNLSEKIDDLKNEKLEVIKEKIQPLIKKRENINNLKLHSMLNQYCDIDIVFKDNIAVNPIGNKKDFNEIKEDHYFTLLKYLIRNGYIDEDYADYMSYFYPNSLKEKDKIFMRSVTDRRAKPWDFLIENAHLIVEGLRDIDFDHEGILNFDLFFFLLSSHKNVHHKSLLERIFKQIINNKNYNFIQAIYSTKKKYNIPLFTIFLNNRWTTLMEDVLSGKSGFDTDVKRLYLITTLSNCTTDNIIEININNSLTEYISNEPRFLDMSGLDYIEGHFLDNLESLNVRFKSLIFETSNPYLFGEVYNRSLYDINKSNIELMINGLCGIKIDNFFWSTNLTIIANLNNSPIANYINEYKDLYISIVLSESKGIISDDEEIAKSVINDKNISIENRKQYIENLKVKLRYLIETKEEKLWETLLYYNVVTYSEENIVQYFIKKGFDETLVTFIQNEKKKFDFSNLEEFEHSELFNAVVSYNKMNTWHYREILQALNWKYNNNFNVEGLDTSKINVLIELLKIPMMIENLMFIRDKYADQTIPFILTDIDIYVELIDARTYVKNEMLALLTVDEVLDSHKIRLLTFESGELYVVNKGYSELVENYILENNFSIDELKDIITIYNKKPTSTKEIIFKNVVYYIEYTLDDNYSIPDKLFELLLSSDDINLIIKDRMLISRFNQITKKQSERYLKLMGRDELATVFEGMMPKVIKSKETNTILTKFKEKGWILDFCVDDKDSSYYVVCKKLVQETSNV